MSRAVSINKYLPIALLYFFFNGFLLPQGLLYTTLLTPFLLLWLNKFPVIKKIWLFFAIFLPYLVIHFYNGVHAVFYLRSFALLFSVYVFALAFYQFLTICKTLRILYKNLILLNVIFIVIGLIAFFLPSLKNTFWYTNEITLGIQSVRLKMLTYEPSYYSLLFVPIALYYSLKLIVLKLPNPAIVVCLLTVPLLLSLSFGIILGLIMAILFTLLWGSKAFFPGKNIPLYIILTGFFLLIALIIAMQLFPDNVFVVRIANSFSGKDASFKGRTFDSFYLGWEIASKKSVLFGAGLGQTKLLGLDIFNSFYNTTAYNTQNVGIPNSLGDTLASLGLVGLSLRLFLEVYFFFKTQVYTNYYRLSLFLFIFIYQFTGSFITNIAEYVVWVMAFHRGIFSEFDKVMFRIRHRAEDIVKPEQDQLIRPA